MRIISGKHRGRVLASFQGTEIRPTSDRVKESLFSILSARIAGARVLDLFCGSGALGLECLSRGAKEVIFNDLSRESLDLLKKNLALLKEQAIVQNYDFETCLKRAEGKFDIIFIDPPYAQQYCERALTLIYERQLLAEGGLVVYESERVAEVSPRGMVLQDERSYGRTKLFFFGREEV